MTWGKRGRITDVRISASCYDCSQACANLLCIKATFAIEAQRAEAPRVRVDWQSIEGGCSWQATEPFG
jgi:hypothetical protein